MKNEYAFWCWVTMIAEGCTDIQPYATEPGIVETIKGYYP